jgi:starch phosphorylase
VYKFTRDPQFEGRVAFVEDYEMHAAHVLVQGVDVWLNLPRVPLEASGTSGMKAAANGALNLSTLDGWWDEAWKLLRLRNGSAPIGWAIGSGEEYQDRSLQDQVEADALYNLLEQDVVPAFYERGASRLPQRWIARMKASLSTLCCEFNTHRMVKEYTERFYLPAQSHFHHLAENEAAGARALASWLQRIRSGWGDVAVRLESSPPPSLKVGEPQSVRARVTLGRLEPSDVAVELYLGRLNAQGDITEPSTGKMNAVEQAGPGEYIFEAEYVACVQSGLHGYTVRVIPDHPDMATSFWPGLIAWATGQIQAARA